MASNCRQALLFSLSPSGHRALGVQSGSCVAYLNRWKPDVQPKLPSRALRGYGADLNRALCPKRAPPTGVAALVHRCSIVLSDAERFVGVGSRPCSSDAMHFVPRLERRSCLVLASPPTCRCAEDHAVPTSRRNATWLILPVVICLSQRLSHACVSMN